MAWKRGKKLSPVSEQDAEGEIRRIYSEIRSSLGITFVPAAYQLLAAEPVFLAEHWRIFSGLLNTKCFKQCTDRLRADAYTRVHNYFKIHDTNAELTQLTFSEGAKEELTYVVDLFHYLNPVLMLIVSAQAQAFEGAIGTREASEEAIHRPRFPRTPVLTDDSAATAPVRRIFDEAKQVTGLPLVSSDFRALARWPEFLDCYWGPLRGMIRSPLFSECQRAVEDTASTLVQELPGPIELTLSQLADKGIGEDEISGIVRVIEAMVHGFATQCLNMSVAKIGLEGGNLAQVEGTGRERTSQVA